MWWRATFGAPEAMPQGFCADRSGYLRIAAVIGALVWVIALMDFLGFCLVMLAFYVFLLRVLGRPHPAVAAIIAVAGSFGVYYVFVHWLAVSLPVGVLGV
jgi:putative tricarboxylic transport membrane protein